MWDPVSEKSQGFCLYIVYGISTFELVFIGSLVLILDKQIIFKHIDSGTF